jgi:hypothetical protein
VTFDAAPATSAPPALDLAATERLTVCDLTGAERFLVWSMRWCTSIHEDPEFADLCLRDSFERAGLAACLPGFRSFVTAAHGPPEPAPPAARLGCWRIKEREARMLHTVACLQSGQFGDAWRQLVAGCGRDEAARAMLALGEIADALNMLHARVRRWNTAPAADRQTP